MAENEAPERRLWVARARDHVHLQPQINCPCGQIEYIRADLAAPNAAQLPTGESILREYVEHELDDHYDGPNVETELVIPHPPVGLIERIDDALRQARRADAVRQARRETRTEKDAEDAAKEIVRAWLLSSNPYHLIDYKQQLIDRIAAALRAEGEKGE